MKKLQQFNILSFNYDRLKNNGYNIKITPMQAEVNGELIALADSEVLRAIRRLTEHKFSENFLYELVEERSKLVKRANSEENKKRIAELNNEIRNLLFIPEYVSITTDRKASYKKIGRDGFRINGVKFKRLLCGAGHARTNRTMFCAEYIYDKLNKILRCGCKDIDIVLAKWNAYYALTSSATYKVSKPRVCIVADKEIKMTKRVDWVEQSNDGEDSIYEVDKELNFNLWDGMGIISPEFARVWADEMGCDYLPSAFCIRAPFTKGMVCVFDFHKFSKEVANRNIIKDLYGNEVDTDNIDLILTQSQFKLWSAYESYQDYESKLEASGMGWGVSRITPKVEKTYIRTNYQFLQVLNLNEKDIKDICDPTIKWIDGIIGGSATKMALYLLGKKAKEFDIVKTWNNIQDNFLKALLLNNDLVNDSYIYKKIVSSLNKRIRESYIGKLIVDGNFQVMLSDPYALCEHIYGMEVKGLLKEFEHYSKYWNERNVSKVVAMRSPLTWRSEVNLLNFQNNEIVNEWYRYLNSGIVYNVWGCDCMIAADGDFDGDLVCTTNNEQFLKGRCGGNPITYQTQKARKELLDLDMLYSIDALGYNQKIGKITNYSTTTYEMQTRYEKGTREYEELDKRLKLFRFYQGNEIDATKGLERKPIPNNWIKYQKILDTDTREQRANKEFYNSLLIEKRPDFMRYLYSAYNNEYKNFVADFDRLAYSLWGVNYKSVGDEIKCTEDYKYIEKKYNIRNPFLGTNGVMNQISNYMQLRLKEIKTYNKRFDAEKIFDILFNTDIEIDSSKLELMKNKFDEYLQFRKGKMLTESQFSTYEQYYKHLRNDCLQKISTNIKELANLAVYICYKLLPKKDKDFAWDVFGNGIVDNLIEKSYCVYMPKLSTEGKIKYLGETYDLECISLQKEIDFDADEKLLEDLDDIMEEE